MRRLLVALDQDPGPWYGIDLARASGLSAPRLYPLLFRLHSAGWVSRSFEPAWVVGTYAPGPAGRPERAVYALTPEGVRQVARALSATAD